MSAVEDPYRYVYFNGLNLFLKCSLKAGRAGPAGRLGLSYALNVLLNRLHSDLAEGEVREVALRSGSDGWLVGRASGSRVFFLLFDAKYTTLAEVNNEVQSLSAMHFSSIFLE